MTQAYPEPYPGWFITSESQTPGGKTVYSITPAEGDVTIHDVYYDKIPDAAKLHESYRDNLRRCKWHPADDGH